MWYSTTFLASSAATRSVKASPFILWNMTRSSGCMAEKSTAEAIRASCGWMVSAMMRQS